MANFALAQRCRAASPRKHHWAVWLFALATMELAFRAMGDRAVLNVDGQVPPSNRSDEFCVAHWISMSAPTCNATERSTTV